jgi:tetratricopeptide (TPR) repeat protein
LSPYVHQAAVLAYQDLKDRSGVVRHGEAFLQDLPENVLILSILARAFAEMGQPALSIARGTAALRAAGQMLRPSDIEPSAWVAERARLEANIRLSLGMAYLTLAVAEPAARKQELLRNALEHLHKSLESDPASGAVSYRLGLAYLMKQEPEKALKFLARTVALGGPLGNVARTKLDQVLRSQDRRSQPDAETLIGKAQEDLARETQAREARKAVP